MRATLSSLWTGALLAVAVVVVIGVSSALDLQVESYALAGVLAGGVVALIPDRSAFARLAAFAIGFVAAWIGFVLRAALLPDTESGRAVAAIATVLICLIAVAVGRTRLPLSAMLLGVVLLSAAYEPAFVAAEPEVQTTSLDAATALVFAVAVGFAVAALSAARRTTTEGPAKVARRGSAWAIRPRRAHNSEITATTATTATTTEVTR